MVNKGLCRDWESPIVSGRQAYLCTWDVQHTSWTKCSIISSPVASCRSALPCQEWSNWTMQYTTWKTIEQFKEFALDGLLAAGDVPSMHKWTTVCELANYTMYIFVVEGNPARDQAVRKEVSGNSFRPWEEEFDHWGRMHICVNSLIGKDWHFFTRTDIPCG